MTGKSLARATAATIPAVEHAGRILQRANYQFRTLPREWIAAVAHTAPPPIEAVPAVVVVVLVLAYLKQRRYGL